ncbi:MAG: ParB N-terminal domain-containing protein, partial [Oscillospiraceae bacterium]|nr:ParB N-terminal domain-containing protein [Oscillospiraceae bacterium]
HNARKHADEDLATIRASVKEFGFRDPIAVWGPNNIIVEGHGRQIVAQEMGLKTVPVIRLDDMTDEQRRAYALVHNKTAEMSGWDFTELEAELAELEMDFDMSEFGFDDIQVGVSEHYTGQGATEYNEEDFGDDKFKCECPRCGFKFNP